jgi:hypothetical protein
MKIAQRFIAGSDALLGKQVREADGRMFNDGFGFSVAGFTGSEENRRATYPAVNCWAISNRPLRGLNTTFY